MKMVVEFTLYRNFYFYTATVRKFFSSPSNSSPVVSVKAFFVFVL